MVIRKIHFLSYLLIFLVLSDLIATIYWISSGVATEANPIMEYYLGHSVLLFSVVKLSLSFSSVWLLLRFKSKFKKLIYHSLIMITLIYVGVFIWHLTGLFFLID